VETPVNGYDKILVGDSRPDIVYHLNSMMVDGKQPFAALDTAVGCSNLENRQEFLEQDDFLRDHIESRDVLVVSVGWNDFARMPKGRQILKKFGDALSAIHVENGSPWKGSQKELIDELWNSADYRIVPFRNAAEALFREEMIAYIGKLLSKTTPKLIVLCVYEPSGHTFGSGSSSRSGGGGGGWIQTLMNFLSLPDLTLIGPYLPAALMGLEKLLKTKTVPELEQRFGGLKVVVQAMSEKMDRDDPEDYANHGSAPEPSDKGGKDIAELLFAKVKDEYPNRDR